MWSFFCQSFVSASLPDRLFGSRRSVIRDRLRFANFTPRPDLFEEYTTHVTLTIGRMLPGAWMDKFGRVVFASRITAISAISQAVFVEPEQTGQGARSADEQNPF
jgi:hypothetical protein